MKLINTETGRVTKRFVMTFLGAALIWWFLREHRNWVWAYFESVMTLSSPEPAQVVAAQAIASASISALTTGFITASTTIAALVIWFVTGNVMALQSMFKWSSTATAAGTAALQVTEQDATKSELQHVIHQGAPGAPERPPFTPHSDEP